MIMMNGGAFEVRRHFPSSNISHLDFISGAQYILCMNCKTAS